MSLSGKVALVTGASRGIGRGIALQLGAAGAKVYVTGREPKKSYAAVESSMPSLERTSQGKHLTIFCSRVVFFLEITERGGQGIFIYVDHSDMTQVKQLFERISNENNGRLDILINNAYSAVGVSIRTFFIEF